MKLAVGTGSGELIASLLAAGLVDAFLLMIHPLVLGPGRRHARVNLPGPLPTRIDSPGLIFTA